MHKRNHRDPLQSAIAKAGSQYALAALIKTGQGTISNSISRGYVTTDMAPRIERALKGFVTCEELRPDLGWVRIPDPSWPHPKGRPAHDLMNDLRWKVDA